MDTSADKINAAVDLHISLIDMKDVDCLWRPYRSFCATWYVGMRVCHSLLIGKDKKEYLI